MTDPRVIDLKKLYGETAKLAELAAYVDAAVAHALHGKARKLVYASPVTGEIVIFDHSPV